MWKYAMTQIHEMYAMKLHFPIGQAQHGNYAALNGLHQMQPWDDPSCNKCTKPLQPCSLPPGSGLAVGSAGLASDTESGTPFHTKEIRKPGIPLFNYQLKTKDPTTLTKTAFL